MRFGRIQLQPIRHSAAGRRVSARRHRHRPETPQICRCAGDFPQNGTTHLERRLQILLRQKSGRCPHRRRRHRRHLRGAAGATRPLPRAAKRHRFSVEIYLFQSQRRFCGRHRLQRQGRRGVQHRQIQRPARSRRVAARPRLLRLDDECRLFAIHKKSIDTNKTTQHEVTYDAAATQNLIKFKSHSL